VLLTQAVLGEALASTQPLQTFLVTLDQVGGYKEDSVRKKSLLLAMILNDRPETFLPLRDDEHITPIIDYHFMRSCLRIGLIDVLDGELETKLTNRQIVSPAEEWAVRYPAYLALEGVVLLSGKSLGAVNSFLFTNARKRCPEMTEPQCRLCSLDPVWPIAKSCFNPSCGPVFIDLRIQWRNDKAGGGLIGHRPSSRCSGRGCRQGEPRKSRMESLAWLHLLAPARHRPQGNRIQRLNFAENRETKAFVEYSTRRAGGLEIGEIPALIDVRQPSLKQPCALAVSLKYWVDADLTEIPVRLVRLVFRHSFQNLR
jgi:hypothetical protein